MNEQQQIEQWQKDRMGKITASMFADFVKKDKQGNYFLSDSETAKNLIYKIAWERLVLNGDFANALNRLGVSSQATEHGNMYEGAAVLRYEKFTGRTVEYINRYNAYNDSVGGTPDGYIGEDGIIEVKCPYNGGNHLRTLLTGEMYNKDYGYQIQGYLMITGRKWCDFVTYDPDMPEGLDISVNRIDRDEDIIEGIKLVIGEAVEKLKEIINQIKTDGKQKV